MNGLFQPSFRDGKTGAEIVAGLVQGQPYDTIIGYDEIADALGIPEDSYRVIHGAVNRAKRRLNRDHMRHLVAVPGKGYKVIYPGEAATEASRFRRKSDRAISRAISVIKSADERDMTEQERTRNRQVGMVMQALHERQQEVEARAARMERLLLGKPGATPPPPSPS